MQVPALADVVDRVDRVARRLALGQEALEAVGDDRVLEPALGPEVVVERRRLDAGPLGDRAGRDLGALGGVEQLGGGESGAGRGRQAMATRSISPSRSVKASVRSASPPGKSPTRWTSTLKRSSADALGAGDRRRVRVLGDDGLAPAADRVAPDVRLALVDRGPVLGEAAGQRFEVLLVGGAQIARDDVRCSTHSSSV